MAGNAIRVVGATETARALDEFADDLDQELAQASKTVADHVRQEAKSNALALGGVAAKSAPAIALEDSPDGAAVALGGTAYPFALGAEFGSMKYAQFEPWRGTEGGYFLYPAIRESEEQNVETYEAAIDALLNRAGLA